MTAGSEAAALSLGPDLQELTRLKEWLKVRGREHRLDADLVDRLLYCSEELFTNIIAHNAPGEGMIRVRLEVRDGEAALIIEDEGVAFDPTKVPPPAKPRSLEEAPVGGLGLHLVRQFSSGMEYQRRGGTNHLVVRFASGATRRQPAA